MIWLFLVLFSFVKVFFSGTTQEYFHPPIDKFLAPLEKIMYCTLSNTQRNEIKHLKLMFTSSTNNAQSSLFLLTLTIPQRIWKLDQGPGLIFLV